MNKVCCTCKYFPVSAVDIVVVSVRTQWPGGNLINACQIHFVGHTKTNVILAGHASYFIARKRLKVKRIRDGMYVGTGNNIFIAEDKQLKRGKTRCGTDRLSFWVNITTIDTLTMIKGKIYRLAIQEIIYLRLFNNPKYTKFLMYNFSFIAKGPSNF